jgi:hypothetical protein
MYDCNTTAKRLLKQLVRPKQKQKKTFISDNNLH